MTERIVGKVLRLNIEKGYGFLEDEQRLQHFFHRRAVEGVAFEQLRQGQRVTFEKGDTGRGPRAESVRVSQGND